MAKAISNNSMITFVLAVIFAIVAVANAQEMAPSPAPAAGAGFSLPTSSVVVAFSLLFSLVSLFKH
ncbi:Arabinogalactan protein 16 [Bienertia sinuspersici]